MFKTAAFPMARILAASDHSELCLSESGNFNMISSSVTPRMQVMLCNYADLGIGNL